MFRIEVTEFLLFLYKELLVLIMIEVKKNSEYFS